MRFPVALTLEIRFDESSGIFRPRPDDDHIVQRQKSCQGIASFLRAVWRVDQTRMCEDPKELAEAEHGNSQCIRRGNEFNQTLPRRVMLGRFSAMRMNQDVRINRDQSRLSMQS